MYEGLIVQVGTAEELITKPASDYVAEFTKDIPRSKLLNASSIMDTGNKNNFQDKVKHTDKVEKIAAKVLKSENNFSVLDENNKIIGTISKKEIIKAIFSDT